MDSIVMLFSLLVSLVQCGTCPTDSYDFIVVGSGPGGGPLAVNLANAGYKTLLLEAGDKYISENVTVPAFGQMAAEDENITWNYRVKHYPESETESEGGMAGKRQSVLYPRGSAVGGSAINNAMIVKIPHKTDFDNLANLVGDQSWNDDNMRQYFTRIENNHADTWRGKGHGTEGWLHTSHADPLLVFKPKFDAQALSLVSSVAFNVRSTPGGSLHEGGDVNGGNNNMNEGWHFIPQNVFEGRRAGLVSHLHSQINSNPNLIVKTNHLVTKILFDGKTAIGVQAQVGRSLYKADPRNKKATGKKMEYYAKREVILSAGAYNSPQILMMSGIGDKKHLEEMGIKVKVDLPGVGRNLMDRYEIGVISKTINKFELIKDCLFKPTDDDPCYQFYKDSGRKKGVYSTNGLLVGIDKKFRGSTVPNAFIFAAPTFFEGYYPGFSRETIRKPGHQTWAILIAHTQNKGRVKLKSNNPFETPDINFNYFPGGMDDPDLLVALEALKFARKLNKSTFWSGLISFEAFPSSDLQTDEELKKWIMERAWGHHACCTNKIGETDDEFAVLDKDFKVRGVKNLRVVDASVFPEIPGFFLQTPVMMISEKASDVIIAQAKATRSRC